MAREMGDFVNRGERVLAAYPGLWRNLKLIPSVLDGGPTGRGLFFYLIQLGVAVALAVAAEGLTRRFFAKTRARLAAGSVVARRVRGLSSLAGLAALDLVGLAAVWLVSYGAIGAWFPGSDPQARLAGALRGQHFFVAALSFCIPDHPASGRTRSPPCKHVGCRGGQMLCTAVERCSHRDRRQYRLADPDRYQDATGVRGCRTASGERPDTLGLHFGCPEIPRCSGALARHSCQPGLPGVQGRP